MMLRKTLSAMAIGLTLTLIPASYVFAADTAPTPTATPAAVAKLNAAAQAARLTALKTHGAAEIDRRLASLQKALEKINASTKLAAADKTTLAGQIQAEITGLTALKAKLAADTTLVEARADVQSIFLDYRVYALMLPKMLMISTADRFGQVADKLLLLEAKLTTKLDNLTTAGKDTAAAKATLADIQLKLTDASNQTAGIPAAVMALQPADYNANHALLVKYRDSLKAARADYAAALADAKTVVSDIQTLTGKTSPSPSVSPAN